MTDDHIQGPAIPVAWDETGTYNHPLIKPAPAPPSAPAVADRWDRLRDEALLELAGAAGEMADALSGDAAFRPGMLAYQALADAADLLRLVRHGADRLRLRGQAPTPPTPPTSTPPGPAGRA